jgi:hypothetical protein
MKKSNKIYNQTYCIVIIDEKRIVTLNRKYLPTYSKDNIEANWSDEYIGLLLSSSVMVKKENLIKAKPELSKFSTDTSVITKKDHCFEYFFIYRDLTTLVEIKKSEQNISKTLKNYTGKSLEYYS